MFDLYTAPTPNGWKASVTLEELALPYETHFVNIATGEQSTPAYRAINPNGRIPAIVDREMDDFAVFESGAIMIYLAEKAGRLLPTDAKGTVAGHPMGDVPDGRSWSDDGAGKRLPALHAREDSACDRSLPERGPTAGSRSSTATWPTMNGWRATSRSRTSPTGAGADSSLVGYRTPTPAASRPLEGRNQGTPCLPPGGPRCPSSCQADGRGGGGRLRQRGPEDPSALTALGGEEPETPCRPQTSYRLLGLEASPYTMKVRSFLTFKGLPFEWITRSLANEPPVPEARQGAADPLLFLPNGETMQDSTLIIERLDRETPDPTIHPEDEALWFLSCLFEEFGDEWCNKLMFFQRWFYPQDARATGARLAHDRLEGRWWRPVARPIVARLMVRRMVPRLVYSGGNETNLPSSNSRSRTWSPGWKPTSSQGSI